MLQFSFQVTYLVSYCSLLVTLYFYMQKMALYLKAHAACINIKVTFWVTFFKFALRVCTQKGILYLTVGCSSLYTQGAEEYLSPIQI